MTKHVVKYLLVIVMQLVIASVVVAPMAMVRLVGTTVVIPVSPVDPIDPFRGAYVILEFNGTKVLDSSIPTDDYATSEVYFPLTAPTDGSTEWQVQPGRLERPKGVYLTCTRHARYVTCDNNDFFAHEEKAKQLERAGLDKPLLATMKVSKTGQYTIVDVTTSEG